MADTDGTAHGDDEGATSRLSDLEQAEARRSSGERLDRRFELFEAILLSIAAVLAAWTGFQAAKWSGVQADSYSRSGASRIEATQASTLAGQESVADLVTFSEWLAAAEREGILDDPAFEGPTYVPDPEELSGFLYERFRPEFQVAVEAWLQTEPRLNPDAPTSPFAMPEYRLASEVQSDQLSVEAEGHAADARKANQRSDNYVLMTIVLATVLFFAGISSKMDTLRARLLLICVASTLLVVSLAVVLSFPKEF